MLLSDLSNLPGVSGNEDAVRDYILNEITAYCDSISVDRVGNIVAVVKAGGNKNGEEVPKIMLAAHMDEVGFIVSGVDRNGNLQIMPVGGIDPKVVPGSKVLVGDNDIKGVIGIKAIHLQSEVEFKKTVAIDALRVDIGSDRKKLTENVVIPGDYVVFDTMFEEFGEGLYSGKAFDDRVGCAILIELMRNLKRLPFDLYICFSVKEEIGLAGAKILAESIKPDVAIILEGTTCADLPNVAGHMVSSRLREGPVLAIMDGSSVSSRKLNEFIIAAAKENHIPYQFKNTVTGGNDAAAIQRSAMGAMVSSISVPCRYLHSPVSVISKEDYDNAFYLVTAVIEKLSETGGSIDVH